MLTLESILSLSSLLFYFLAFKTKGVSIFCGFLKKIFFQSLFEQKSVWIRQHQTGVVGIPSPTGTRGKTDERCSSSLCEEYFFLLSQPSLLCLGPALGWLACLSPVSLFYARKLEPQAQTSEASAQACLLLFCCPGGGARVSEGERGTPRKLPERRCELACCNPRAGDKDGANVCFFLNRTGWWGQDFALFWLVWSTSEISFSFKWHKENLS